MSQPNWEFIANLGDADPLTYGGYFVYRDTTGVDFEAEYLLEPECDPDDDAARWRVYRVCLDRCKVVHDGIRQCRYLVPFATPADLSHPMHEFCEWFAKDLRAVASYVGSTVEELEAALCSDDPIARANAYRDIASYHGWENFDSGPYTLTRAEVKARYTRGEL
jgi:hypothetical protein